MNKVFKLVSSLILSLTLSTNLFAQDVSNFCSCACGGTEDVIVTIGDSVETAIDAAKAVYLSKNIVPVAATSTPIANLIAAEEFSPPKAGYFACGASFCSNICDGSASSSTSNSGSSSNNPTSNSSQGGQGGSSSSGSATGGQGGSSGSATGGQGGS